MMKVVVIIWCWMWANWSGGICCRGEWRKRNRRRRIRRRRRRIKIRRRGRGGHFEERVVGKRF